METLSVGMYVRTIGGIERLKKENDNGWFFEKSMIIKPDNIEKYIIKASHNIIDLVRENDFVNGEKVSSIQYDGMGFEHIKCVQTICKFDDLDNRFYTETYFNKDIKSIVTKEQFKSMSYKVGE